METTQEAVLKVGDKVLWRGSWGTEAPVEATIKGIDANVPYGDKYGRAVLEVPWSQVRTSVVVCLTNGKWAYGEQIMPAVQG